MIPVAWDAAPAKLLDEARLVKGSDRVAPRAAVGRILAEPLGEWPAGSLLDDSVADLSLPSVPVRRRLHVGLLSLSATADVVADRLGALGCEVELMGGAGKVDRSLRRSLRKTGAIHDVVVLCGDSLADEADADWSDVAAEANGSLWRTESAAGAFLVWGRVGQADFLALPADPGAAGAVFDALLLPFLGRCQGRQDG